MNNRRRIGVMGAGSIGCFIGGRLLATNKADVVFIGRERLQREVSSNGLTLRDLEANPITLPPEQVRVETTPEALGDCDIVLCCVKSAQTNTVAQALAPILKPHTVVVSLQNGVRNPDILRQHLPQQEVLGGIVDFNVVWAGDGLFHRGTSGPLQLETPGSTIAKQFIDILKQTGLPVRLYDNMSPVQWTKLLVNLNNAIIALSGQPTQTVLLSPAYRRVIAAVIEEAIHITRASNIKLARLRGFPPGIVPGALRLPTFLFRILFGAQLKVDPQARSSMWEDLTRGRLTEVDFLNGEIVRLAEQNGMAAPINQAITQRIHEAEEEGKGPPQLSAQTLSQLMSTHPNQH